MSAVERDVQALSRCLESGATGFVGKNLNSAALEQAIERAIEISESHAILGNSRPLKDLRRQAARLSPYDNIPVLISGERGTGKERVARYIHHNGPRSDGPFVPVNCAGIPLGLLEAELFGAEKGAYTGADSLRRGYIERAHQGVLFLDEIGDMPTSTQAKLLRVLQDGTFRRIGVTEEEITAAFQVICATNIEPDTLIAEGRLREDFFDRIAAVTIRTPPLRDCTEDIPELVGHFLRQMGLESRKQFSERALRLLQAANWPGNVRQLQRTVQAAVVLSEDSETIDIVHLPPRVQSSHADAEVAVADCLVQKSREWPAQRLIAELRMAVQAKRSIQRYKGKQWKAEFMRLMYPECKAQNAKGFGDLIRRITKGPWGCPDWKAHNELSRLIRELTT